MLKPLFLDLALGILLFVILNKFYTSSYAAPFTSYGSSALVDFFGISCTSDISFIFVFFYGLAIFIVNIFVGAAFIFLYTWLNPGINILDILLILCIPNLSFYLSSIIQSLFLFKSLSYLSFSDKLITCIGQLLVFLERTVPMAIGGFASWQFLAMRS